MCGGEVKNARDQACEGYDFMGCREVLRDCALGRIDYRDSIFLMPSRLLGDRLR
jgi:hypothetical protein